MPAKESVITKTEDFIQWFLPKIDKFPRNYKFLFGDRIIQIQLDLLEQLIEAYFKKDKLDHLKAANVEIEKLRHLIKICVGMKFITIDQYEFASRGGDRDSGTHVRGGEIARANSGTVFRRISASWANERRRSSACC